MATITTLTDLHPAWAERFNAKDVEGMLALTEPGQVFVPAPGTPVPPAATRGALEQFLAIGLPISMSVRYAYESGDIGLVIVDWTISGTGADGTAVDLAGSTSDVARRGDDGWKFVIDNPFGTA